MGEREEKSKILIIGGTGRFGSFIVRASIKANHPTFLLVRSSTNALDTWKSKLVNSFKSEGATILYGDLDDYDSLLRAIKQVDVVISAVGHEVSELKRQFMLLDAIQQAGNVKRFYPSEFGNDLEQVQLVEPAKSILAHKLELRHAIREKGIPHTIVCNFLFHGFYFIHGFYLPRLGKAEATSAHRTDGKVFISGDGNTKAIFVNEVDVAKYIIRSVDDPVTLNKVLYVRPPANFYTLNELVSLWEEKNGKKLERIYVREEALLKKIEDSRFPLNFQLAIVHSAFINGDQTNFEIDPVVGVEASVLYADLKYITVDEFLSNHV